MFEKLITDFKKSLPEALRNKLGVADNTDDDQEFEEVENDSDELSVDNSAEEKKKKTKSMIIKVIVILALGYIALDEFVLKDMNPNPETNNVAKAPEEKEITEEAPAVETTESENVSTSEENTREPVGETQTEEVAEVVTKAPTDTVSEIPNDQEAPPIENINVLEKAEESAPTETIAQVEEQPPIQPEEQVISQAKVEESSADQKLDELVENVEQTSQNNPVEEIKVPSSGEVVQAPSMASKIVEEITATLPPVYDQVGRGLVYNCKDKFWACLDKPSYVACNKNQKWNKSKGNSAECVVADIYSSDDDCAKVQKYNVSTSASTAFCQN